MTAAPLVRSALVGASVAITAALSAADLAVLSEHHAENTAASQATLPVRLSDAEFWQLSSELSEPEGFYSSENLVSSERGFPQVVLALEKRSLAGGVYVGVGPEQNFHYIAALRPQMAFILDIRRGNLLVHLLYKAIFELAERRAEFLSLLFSRRPLPLSTGAVSATRLVALLDAAKLESEAGLAHNRQRLFDTLINVHRFSLSGDDLERLGSIYWRFYWHGTQLRYASGSGEFAAGAPPIRTLLSSDEASGGSFLASESRYATVRALHLKNLIVPVIGDFAGSKSVKAIGAYVRSRKSVVSAFYVSDVEQILQRDGRQSEFCVNVATLPRDKASVFIRNWPAMDVQNLTMCR